MKKRNLPKTGAVQQGNFAIDAQKMAKSMNLPKHEREIIHGVQSMGFFPGFRQMRRTNQLLFGLIISAALILYWRGLWAMYDWVSEFLIPTHRFTGALISMLVGLLILVGADAAIKSLNPI